MSKEEIWGLKGIYLLNQNKKNSADSSTEWQNILWIVK